MRPVLAAGGAFALAVLAFLSPGVLRQNPSLARAHGHTPPALLAVALSNLDLTAYASNQLKPEWTLPATRSESTNQGETPFR